MTHIQHSKQQAQTLAKQFRLGLSASAALELPVFLSGVAAELGGNVSPRAVAFGQLLGDMLACQEAQDWLGLADYLEYELVDWLAQAD